MAWPGGTGTNVLDYPDLVSAGAAILIIVGVVILAFFLGRRAGPMLADIWEKHAGARAEGIAARMCNLVRYAIAATLLAVTLEADPWPPVSALILGFFMASATALLIIQVLRSLHFPRWVAALLAIVAFVTLLAKSLGGLQPIMDVLDRVGFTVGKTHFSLLNLIQISVALLVLVVVVRLAGRIASQWIRQAKGLDPTQQLLAQKLVGVALMVAAFFIGIDIIGIDLTALAVFSGAFGLALGFGLQKTFGNLIAGIILLMDRSIKPGDVIVVGDSFGHVNKIGVRAVSIITRDGKEHLIPNENLMTQEVENWSYSSPNVRVHIPVGVAYDCDLALAQKLMIEAATTPSRVLKSPKPTV